MASNALCAAVSGHGAMCRRTRRNIPSGDPVERPSTFRLGNRRETSSSAPSSHWAIGAHVRRRADDRPRPQG
jgi:hypothetical protein